jgi:hypothetical protein
MWGVCGRVGVPTSVGVGGGARHWHIEGTVRADGTPCGDTPKGGYTNIYPYMPLGDARGLACARWTFLKVLRVHLPGHS